MSPKCQLPRFKVHRTVDKVRLNDEADIHWERVNWAGSILGIPELWNISKGKDVNVAILDTGIDTTHPDLATGITKYQDFSGDGIEDYNGHGTHVAGIIGARLNDIGFVGVAPECNFMVGKVLDNGGYGDYDMIAKGIHWAVDEGADIINLSLGGPISTKRLYDAVHHALASGVIVVCAAGNDGWINTNTVGYPGRYGSVITVASHDINGQISGFSSVGGEVDFMAPGDEIWSTYMGGVYAELSGTSMAAPFVAGLCALILANDRATPIIQYEMIETNEDMRNHLMRMATHAGWFHNSRGYGALQPFKYFKY